MTESKKQEITYYQNVVRTLVTIDLERAQAEVLLKFINSLN